MQAVVWGEIEEGHTVGGSRTIQSVGSDYPHKLRTRGGCGATAKGSDLCISEKGSGLCI